MSGLLDAAVAYAAAGWKVFPCAEGANAPPLVAWKDQATCDVGVVRGWWARWPGANIGMPAQNGCFVVDVDNAKALLELRELIDIPETAVAKTPGGYHLWFRGPVSRNAEGSLPAGIDIRGDGSGYVVVAPSVRFDKGYDGAGYVWLSDLEEGIADAPTKLLDLLAETAKQKTARAAREQPDEGSGQWWPKSRGADYSWLSAAVRRYEAGRYLAKITPHEEGGRNSQNFKEGCNAYDWYWLDPDCLWDLLWDWNALRSDPTGSEELDATHNSILGRSKQTGDHLKTFWWRRLIGQPDHPLEASDDAEVVASAAEDRWVEKKAYEVMVVKGSTKVEIEEFRQQILAVKAAASVQVLADTGAYVPNIEKADDSEFARELAAAFAGDDGEQVCVEWGLVHQYRDGIWHSIRDSQLSQMLQTWSDAKLWYQPPDRKGMAMLRIGGGSVTNVCRLVKDRPEGWGRHTGWLEAGRGLAFADCFLAVEGLEVVPRAVGAGNRATFGYPFALDLDAACPRFEKYLASVWEGKADQEARIALLQEFTGAAVLGIAPLFQKSLLLYGDRGTGKSTFLSVLSALFAPMGPGAVAAVEPQEFSDPNQIGRLVGVRLNAVHEMSSRPLLGIDALKQVIDGSPMSVNTKYKAVYEVRPQAAHIFAANELPQAPGAHTSLWDRFIVLSLDRTFRDTSDQILGLGTAVVKDEMPGVMAWAVRGAKRLLANQAYTVPTSSKEKMAEWRSLSCSVGIFYSEKCLRVENVKDGTTARELYQAYCKWAPRGGYKTVSESQFGRRSENLGHKKAKVHGTNVRPVKLEMRVFG